MPPVILRKPEELRPYWQTTDGKTVRLYHGNVLDVLRRLPAGIAQTICTSPPYWGLRDYTVCGCRAVPKQESSTLAGPQGERAPADGRRLPADPACPRCHGTGKTHDGDVAWPDGWKGAYGNEPTPQLYVEHTVLICRELRRVVRDDGVLWWNIGDTYSGGSGGFGTESAKQKSNNGTMIPPREGYKGLPSGNLVGIPFRVALALQADGWILRQEIIWMKPSPMPESVQNRCTKAHEYVFLFAKKPGCYWDAEAIKERTASEVTPEEYATLIQQEKERGEDWYQRANGRKDPEGTGNKAGRKQGGITPPGGRNKRSVWSIEDERAVLGWLQANRPDVLAEYVNQAANKTDVWRIASAGYSGAHFATFPPKLVEPMILAATSAKGACAKCGTPWRRLTEKVALHRDRPNDFVKRAGQEGTGNSCGNTVAGVETRTLGWVPTCECFGKLVKRKGTRLGYGSYHSHNAVGVEYGLRQDGGPASNPGLPTKELATTITEYVSDLPLDQHPIRPCMVLDPFLGSGTSALVALEHGRHAIGIELSQTYLDEHAIPRLTGWLLGRPATRGLVATVPVKEVKLPGRVV